MRRTALVALLLSTLFACRRSTSTAEPTPTPVPPPAPVAARPMVLPDAGGLHAVRCGEATAQWFGDTEALASLRASAPGARVEPALVMSSVTFRTPQGAATADLAAVTGTNDSHAFDVFSPDCTYTALLVDRLGPYHVVRTSDVVDYLRGTTPPLAVVQAGGDGGATGVHHEARWVDGSTLEFFHSCCGGAEVWRASLPSGAMTRLSFTPEAPHGLRRNDGGVEVVP